MGIAADIIRHYRGSKQLYIVQGNICFLAPIDKLWGGCGTNASQTLSICTTGSHGSVSQPQVNQDTNPKQKPAEAKHVLH